MVHDNQRHKTFTSAGFQLWAETIAFLCQVWHGMVRFNR